MIIKRNDLKVDAILTSDWHMRLDNPPCRLDDHSSAQIDKIEQISSLQRKFNCPVLNGGDVFQIYYPSPTLINICLDHFPKRMMAVAGQHDLPDHNIDLIKKSAFYTLARGGAFLFLNGQTNWKTYSKKPNYLTIGLKKIAIAHMLVWDKDEPFPNCPAPRVNKVFKMFPKADLILTGDNHQTFTARKGKQLLVNPGSLTRHKADQADHRPCVFLWSAATNTYRKHYLKIRKGVIDRTHIDIINEKKERKEAFIEQLDDSWDIELSFEDNIANALTINSLGKSEKYVYKWMEV